MLHVLGGITQLRKGDWAAVSQESQTAITLATQAGKPVEEAFAHRLLSVYWHVMGDLNQAKDHCNRRH